MHKFMEEIQSRIQNQHSKYKTELVPNRQLVFLSCYSLILKALSPNKYSFLP